MHSLPLLLRAVRTLGQRFGFLFGLVLLGTAACAHPTTSPNATPAATAFGLGPRSSERGLYTAVLQSAGALRATLTSADAHP